MKTKPTLYNLKTVTLLTGINEHTLRAWELRYGAISPRRSEAGRRMYDQSQIERIRMLMTLSDLGHAIGTIAVMTDSELANLFSRSVSLQDRSAAADSSAGQEHMSDLLALVEKFDLVNVRALLQQRMLQLGAVDFVLHVVSRLMMHIGALTAGGGISVAQEHAVSAIVKGALFELLFSVTPAKAASGVRRRKIVFATMEGDFHELGILCASVLARIAGHEAIYLGPNTPPSAVAAAVNSLRATDVMIGVVDMHASLLKAGAGDYLRMLQPLLGDNVRVGFGGSPRMLAGLTDRPDVTVFPSLSEFQKSL
jgi:methanogenic corrinoid protein MtbC1